MTCRTFTMHPHIGKVRKEPTARKPTNQSVSQAINPQAIKLVWYHNSSSIISCCHSGEQYYEDRRLGNENMEQVVTCMNSRSERSAQCSESHREWRPPGASWLSYFVLENLPRNIRLSPAISLLSTSANSRRSIYLSQQSSPWDKCLIYHAVTQSWDTEYPHPAVANSFKSVGHA